jgi:hypothetical protein
VSRPDPRRAVLAAPALLPALLLALLAACRGGVDDPCRCASDCRAGLVCSAEGEKTLTPNLCYDAGVSGVCTPAEDQESDSSPVELTEPSVYNDMASRRDFQPGGSISESLSDGTTDATTTGQTGTDSSTGETTGSTGSTTDTSGTESTGDSSSGSSGSSSTT